MSSDPPGEVVVECGAAVDPSVRRYERPERGRDAPPEPGHLVRQVDVDRTVRRVLLAPAPSRLALPMRSLSVDSLALAGAVVDHGWTVEGDALRRKQGMSDGAVLAVEIEADGVAKRIWSRAVDPGSGWFEDDVDLSPWRGRDVVLQLVVEAGPMGPADFDYAVWGDLRLRGPAAAPPDRPHVILLHLDTLRADRLGCYGHDVPTSPRLDAWAAARATVFEDTLADASWTLPSAASILTGLTVHQHGVGDFPARLTEQHQPLAHVLRRQGYATYGVCEGHYMAAPFGFAVGFDVYDWQAREEPDWSGALRWLEQRHGERLVFLFLQTYLVHHPFPPDAGNLPEEVPYEGPLAGREINWSDVIGPFLKGQLSLSEEDQRYIRRQYDSAVRRLDDVVVDFLERIEPILASQKVLILITSDHGDEHGEHGAWDHGHSLYGELLQVPLIVRFPNREPDRVARPASTLDIAPTILDYAGLPIPAHLPGRSLRGVLPERRARVSQDKGSIWSLQLDGWKLILTRPMGAEVETVQLFHLRKDPGELHDLAEREPRRVRALRGQLEQYLERTRYAIVPVAAAPTIADPDEETLEQLRELGYLGGH